jgi:hypothetical protein
MRSYACCWAVAAAMILAAASLLTAQQPPSSSPPVAETGRVLLLDNNSVLEGVVERQAENYVVRGAVGELKVPAAKALAVLASLEEAYQLLKSRINLQDGEERLKLAQWCHTHGLPMQAIAETQASIQLRPGHVESKQFLAMLERTAAPGNPPPRVEEATPPGKVQSLSVTADCLALFSTKVQPILMNACAGCHTNGRGGSFVLARPTDGVARHATQINLAMVVRQVNFDKPAASPLLTKACYSHGEPGAPSSRNQTSMLDQKGGPFLTLQSWVQQLVVENRHLKEQGMPVGTAVSTQGHLASTETANKFFLDLSAGANDSCAVIPAARAVEMTSSLVKNNGAESLAPPLSRFVPSGTQPPIVAGPGIAAQLQDQVDKLKAQGLVVNVVPSATQSQGTNSPGIARALQANESTPPLPASPYDPAPFNQLMKSSSN